MQRLIFVLVLMLGSLAGMRIYDNMASSEPYEIAYSLACDAWPGCPEDMPVFEEPGPFEHRFVFDMDEGMLEIRCRWTYLISGAIECEPRRERHDARAPTRERRIVNYY